MAKFKNQEGEEVEAFTQEELDAKVAEAKTEAESAAGEKFERLKGEKEEIEGKVTEKDTKITELEEQLKEAAGDNKDKNFKALREAKEKIEKERDGLQEKLDGVDEKIDGAKKEIGDKIDLDKMEGKMDVMSKGDPELAKKIKFYFNSFKPAEEQEKDPEKRAELIKEQLANAYSLASGKKVSEGMPSEIVQTGGEHVPPQPKPGSKMSDGAKDMGKKMFNLEDKDFEAAEQK